jgi:hypothetical protein
VFNSRVTSEALEAKFRQVFPAQAGAELIQDLYASGVIQPVIDFSSVAEGSVLSQNLQTAWDFATGHSTVANTTSTLISNTGFWRVQVNPTILATSIALSGSIQITDGLTNKIIWEINTIAGAPDVGFSQAPADFVVFLRTGDSLTATSSNTNPVLDIVYRQIADVNGNLVNPLGFTFS